MRNSEGLISSVVEPQGQGNFKVRGSNPPVEEEEWANESIPYSNLNVTTSFSTAGEGFDSRLGISSLGF